MVGWRGEAPLVPTYRFRSPNKAMALSLKQRWLHPTRTARKVATLPPPFPFPSATTLSDDSHR